jgi:phage tail-like protein
MKRTELELLLPGVFQRTIGGSNPLVVFLELMEQLHAPSEWILEHLDEFFDPRRTTEPFVPYLAGWVDLAWLLLDPSDDPYSTRVTLFPTGPGFLRELVAFAAFHSMWRGTSLGLLHFLEAATGLSGFRIDEQVRDVEGRPLPYHIRVHAPKDAEPYRELIDLIVTHEKPAYVTYDSDLAFDV